MYTTATVRKLVLHLDVNNTILVGDSRTKQATLAEALNEYLVDVVYGRVDENHEWKIHSKTLSERPPNAGLLSYYRFAQGKFVGKSRDLFKSHIRRFTEEESGKPFRCYYDQMLTALQCKFPRDTKENLNSGNLPSVKDSAGLPYHCIVPSFYKLLEHLHENSRDFAIAFRTYGGDGHIALQAAEQFLSGRHFNAETCEVNKSEGIITRSRNLICLKLPGNVTHRNLDDVYAYFSHLHGVSLFVDDYSWWRTEGYNSKAGKPLLIDLQDKSVHHIMFDDNFRAWEPEDSIVDLRVAKDGSFSSADPAMFEDICVVKSDLFQSICNPNYFIDKIELCERNYNRLLSENKD